MRQREGKTHSKGRILLHGENLRGRIGGISLVKTRLMPRGYLIYCTSLPHRVALRVSLLTLSTTMTMTGDGSSKPQPDFVSLLKHHIISIPRRFRKLSIRGKVSS